ncbi:MAG: metalloregulator ArsR/SmtB family transcription factor [Candidatus Wallbacteria bacterium]|nr:metalloregulator ArsR/SmtB family transcription factor [Candidatus Wallbacteria bacterium]
MKQKKIPRKYETRARILKALGHPTRLFIVDTLSKEQKCVCELTELVGADISTVSRHLSILKEAGILRIEKTGNQVFYEIVCPCIMEIFPCIEKTLNERLKDEEM